MDFRKIIESEYYDTRNIRDDLKNIPDDTIKHLTDSDRLPFSIALVNLTGDLNIGVCIRSAVLLGAKRVLVIGRNRIDKRSFVGADNWIDIHKHIRILFCKC